MRKKTISETLPLNKGLKLDEKGTKKDRGSISETLPLNKGLKLSLNATDAARQAISETLPLNKGLKHDPEYFVGDIKIDFRDTSIKQRIETWMIPS